MSREVLVLCAVDEEARHLRALLSDAHTVADAIFPTTVGTIEGISVRLVVCLIGISHAAACTASVLRPNTIAVINYGCAGAHDPTLCPGDVVIGTGTTLMDARKVLPDGSTRVAGFRRDLEWANVHVLECDATLVKHGQEAGSEQLPRWPGSERAPRVVCGRVGSSDTWTQQAARLLELAAVHGTSCEDMEAASIACVLFHLGSARGSPIPFLSVKDISNNELQATTNPADGLEGISDEVGKRAAILVRGVIARISSTLGASM